MHLVINGNTKQNRQLVLSEEAYWRLGGELAWVAPPEKQFWNRTGRNISP